MAAITVRQIDDSVVERLKARARVNGRSLAAEVRQILGAAVETELVDRRVLFLELVKQLQEEIERKESDAPSESSIGADRDRNHGR